MNRFTRMTRLKTVLFLLLMPSLVLAGVSHVPAAPAVTLVTDAESGPATRHGLSKLSKALKHKEITILSGRAIETAEDADCVVVGLASGKGTAAGLLKRTGSELADDPESLLVRHVEIQGRPGLLVTGSDDRGLMYGLLDVANQVRLAKDSGDVLAGIRDVAESPFVPDRALSIYTMHQACFEQRFYNEAYWARYLDVLAANRFNRFVLIFGYENWGYVSPPRSFKLSLIAVSAPSPAWMQW